MFLEARSKIAHDHLGALDRLVFSIHHHSRKLPSLLQDDLDPRIPRAFTNLNIRRVAVHIAGPLGDQFILSLLETAQEELAAIGSLHARSGNEIGAPLGAPLDPDPIDGLTLAVAHHSLDLTAKLNLEIADLHLLAGGQGELIRVAFEVAGHLDPNLELLPGLDVTDDKAARAVAGRVSKHPQRGLGIRGRTNLYMRPGNHIAGGIDNGSEHQAGLVELEDLLILLALPDRDLFLLTSVVLGPNIDVYRAAPAAETANNVGSLLVRNRLLAKIGKIARRNCRSCDRLVRLRIENKTRQATAGAQSKADLFLRRLYILALQGLVVLMRNHQHIASIDEGIKPEEAVFIGEPVILGEIDLDLVTRLNMHPDRVGPNPGAHHRLIIRSPDVT